MTTYDPESSWLEELKSQWMKGMGQSRLGRKWLDFLDLFYTEELLKFSGIKKPLLKMTRSTPPWYISVMGSGKNAPLHLWLLERITILQIAKQIKGVTGNLSERQKLLIAQGTIINPPV